MLSKKWIASNQRWTTLFVVFIVTFLVRTLFIVQWHDTPYATVPLLDAKVYYDWASDIASGEWLRGKAFYQSPLYPYLLGVLFALFGKSLVLVSFINALFESLTATLLADCALLFFGSASAALFTGALAAFYRPMIFYTAPVMKEPLALFLLALFFRLVLGVSTQNKPGKTWRFAACGAIVGLAVLVRGNFLFFLPVVLLFGFWRWRKAFVSRAIAFVFGAVLMISPATIHNYVVSDDFVLVNYTDGFNLYIGHSPMANGTNAYPPEVSTDPVQEEMNTIWVAMKNNGHTLSPSEVSSYWRGQALEAMWTDPWRTVTLTVDKARAFWNGHEQFDNYDISFIEQNFSTLLSLPLVTFSIVSSLAAWGAVCAWRRYRLVVLLHVGFAALYMGSVLLFYVTDRYRLPIVIFLLPLAGVGGASLLQKLWMLAGQTCTTDLWPDTKSSIVGSVLVAAFLTLGLIPPQHPVNLEAFNWGTLSMVYADREEDDLAIDAFERAVAISPVEAGASSYVRASYAYEHKHQDQRALSVLIRALAVFPKDGILLYNFARFKAARGQLTEALPLFEQAARLSPFYLLNYYALSKGYLLRGDKLRAQAYAQAGLDIDPSDRNLLQVWGELHQ